jgi:hypothetical protein
VDFDEADLRPIGKKVAVMLESQSDPRLRQACRRGDRIGRDGDRPRRLHGTT